MSEVNPNCRYADSHEWVNVEGNIATVGISDHAQGLLGDLVYVELPELDAEVSRGDDAGVVESVKAASDVYAPVSGKIIEINEDLEDNPELVNSSPYESGWLYRIELQDAAEVNSLMSADEYESHIEE